MKSKKQEEEPELKRDIIEEYHNFASRVIIWNLNKD